MVTDTLPQATINEAIPNSVHAMLLDFKDVFIEPMFFPPKQSHDHHIVLTKDTDAISLRPYIYDHDQKVEIERLIKEMLETDAIRPSNSPFSSQFSWLKRRMTLSIFVWIIRPLMPW